MQIPKSAVSERDIKGGSSVRLQIVLVLVVGTMVLISKRKRRKDFRQNSSTWCFCSYKEILAALYYSSSRYTLEFSSNIWRTSCGLRRGFASSAVV